MFTAADVIELLGQRRRRRSIRPEVPGQLPPGWQSWLEAMPPAEAAVTGAHPQAFIDELAQRPLAQPPRRAAQLNRWQAFGALWRQQWHAPVAEERGTRWFAAAFSGVLHCVLVAMLLWLAYVRIEPPAARAEGDTVVQVEFIGRGTPREQGGGTAVGPTAQPEPAASSRAAAARPPTHAQAPPAEAAPAQPQATPEITRSEESPPSQPEPPAPQPLQVTQVPEPDSSFVLPPPRPREFVLPQRQISVPEVHPPTPRIAEVEVPRPVAVQVERPQLRVESTPRLRAEPVPEPETSARMPQVRARELPTGRNAPDLRVPQVQAQVRDIPMPDLGTAPVPAKSGEASTAAAAPAAGSPSRSAAGTPAPAVSGTQRAANSGTGPATAAKPGAWPTPERGDDWGASTRDRPGGQPGARPGQAPGVFNADGTPRLVDAPASGGNAPGTVEQRIADLDRAGTWLKRPPYDYTPTTFDKYWRPRETLLQEWVRKGIKKLSIPIPGTDKKIECVVSLLQFGGGCGIRDPNMNEQPATARPPPDIPFKPALQEDNGSVKPPVP